MARRINGLPNAGWGCAILTRGTDGATCARINPSLFAIAGNLQVNCYENRANADNVAGARPQIERFQDELEPLAAP